MLFGRGSASSEIAYNVLFDRPPMSIAPQTMTMYIIVSREWVDAMRSKIAKLLESPFRKIESGHKLEFAAFSMEPIPEIKHLQHPTHGVLFEADDGFTLCDAEYRVHFLLHREWMQPLR